MARRLIIGFDGSANGEDALALGALLAATLEADPLVVTVVPFDAGGAETEAELERIQGAARHRLGEVEFRPLYDDSAPHALKRLAAELEAAGIVAGASHRSAIGRLILGSVGSGLLTHPPCAVAIAPHGYADGRAQELRLIGAATDGSPEAERACATAAALAARGGGTLVLVSVVEPPPTSYSLPPTATDLEQYGRAAEGAARQAAERAAAAAPDGLGTEIRLPHGDPAQELARVAADLDLIVVGSRGHGTVHRAIVGSVAQALIASSPAPVLVVPREAASGS